jgi:hypothetical protein
MSEQPAIERPTLVQKFVEFFVRAAEILVLTVGFWIAAERSGSRVLGAIAIALGIVMFMPTYGSGMRLLDRIGNAVQPENDKGCGSFILQRLLIPRGW